MAIIPQRLTSIIAEANRIAPHRRGWDGHNSSDGTYVNKPGDHNVDSRGICHAVDLGQSMPGTPYWEDRFDEFDVHALQRQIAAEYVAATDADRKRQWRWLYDGGYMHSYDYARKVDIIFHPAVSLTWRVDNNPPSEHIQHGHFSIGHTVAAENDTQPIFGEDEFEMDEARLREIIREEIEAQAKQINQHTSAVSNDIVERIGNYPGVKE